MICVWGGAVARWVCARLFFGPFLIRSRNPRFLHGVSCWGYGECPFPQVRGEEGSLHRSCTQEFALPMGRFGRRSPPLVIATPLSKLQYA